MSTTYPLQFLAVGKTAEAGTSPGLYLRWVVRPYLGVPGISPLHPGELGAPVGEPPGFRLFFDGEHRAQPGLQDIPLAPFLPNNPGCVCFPMHKHPGMLALFETGQPPLELHLDLAQLYGDSVIYLRFAYFLFPGERLSVTYEIADSATGAIVQHRVPLHFRALQETWDRVPPDPDRPGDRHEELEYAIHVDRPHESIAAVSFTTNGRLVVGNFQYAEPPARSFYAWSPPGGSPVWQEVDPANYLFQALADPSIGPAQPAQLVPALQEFYDRYYGEAPAHEDGNEIRFVHPPLPQVYPARALERTYLADQYDLLCRGQPPRGGPEHAHVPPQEAAAAASLDPAVAYLLGLYRVLTWNHQTERPGFYKVQGSWPDGWRYCAYAQFDPALDLVEPHIDACQAAPVPSTQTLLDYATSRIHHPLNGARLTWELPPKQPGQPPVRSDPAAYIVLAQKPQTPGARCLWPFYIPRPEDSAEHAATHVKRVTCVDWYDLYPGTDIRKVMDGRYGYSLAGFDIFGQMSNFASDSLDVGPWRQHMGGIEAPEIELVSDDDETKAIDIPLDVTWNGQGYEMLQGGARDLRFVYSFFWPLESRYLWNANRATAQPSLGWFNVLYLAGTPLFSRVTFNIINRTTSGIEIKLEDVSALASAANHDLHLLLAQLGAVNAAGSLVGTAAEAALLGGRVSFSRDFQIAHVDVMSGSNSIKLQLVLSRDSEKESIAKAGLYKPTTTDEKLSSTLRGRLYWNSQAMLGGSLLGWNTLNSVGEQIAPSPLVPIDAPLATKLGTPATVQEAVADLVPDTGIIAYRAPQTAAEHAETGYWFEITLPAGHKLGQYRRLQVTPVDPATGLQPGEYDKRDHPNAGEIEIPDSVQVLFSPERIRSFYARRLPDDPDHPGQVRYRGEPVTFTSRANNREYLLFPSPVHAHWLVLTPNQVAKRVPLGDFDLHGHFKPDNSLTTSLAIAVQAVASGKDGEVGDSLQAAIVVKKLSFVRGLPPPELVVEDQPQPSFGVTASPPGYDGCSVIRAEKIFAGYDLRAALDGNKQYVLYRLPASRLMGSAFPITYARDPDSENKYRRNMHDLQASLDAGKAKSAVPHYLDVPSIREGFEKFGDRVTPGAVSKDALLRLPVLLPGETSTVFLFALRAYDPAARKESPFACLSMPVYVEDVTPPAAPTVLSALFETSGNKIDVQIEVNRRLTQDSYDGLVESGYLALHKELCGSRFPYSVEEYLLYLTNEAATAARSDDSDFYPVTDLTKDITSHGLAANRISLKLVPQVSVDPVREVVTLKATLRFAPGVDIPNMPARLYYCLRAFNYLGQRSPLRMIPSALSELVL